MSYIVLFCHSVSMATMEHNNRFWITELETTVGGVLGEIEFGRNYPMYDP